MNEFLRTGHFIGGEWHESHGASDATYPVLNPATGETIAKVAKGGADDTQRAIDAAAHAFPAWRALTARTRRPRETLGELMLENRDALAELLTREQASRSRKRVAKSRMRRAFEWFAEEAKRMYGDVIPARSRMRRSSSRASRSAWSRRSRRGISRWR